MPRPLTTARASTSIRRKVVQSVFDAFGFAALRQHPLNVYATINLPDDAPGEAVRAFAVVRKRHAAWLDYKRRKDGEAAQLFPHYAYAFERPGSQTHVNWVLHVPADLREEFAAKLDTWLERAGVSVRPFDVKIKALATQADSKRVANYVMKGVEEGYADHFHLSGIATPQGIILGKRAGCSRSLADAARKEGMFDRRAAHRLARVA